MLRCRRTLAALIVMASGMGCLGRQPLTPPSQGGSIWAELKTKHFTLISDLNARDAERVMGGLEEVYGLLGSVLFENAPVPSFQTNAVVFEHMEDLRQFVGDDTAGQYRSSLESDLEPTPTVLAFGTLSPLARIYFAHELTHRFNHVALGPTPVWLNEGLAEYYSTIRGENGAPVLGETDPRYMCTPSGLGDLVCGQYERVAANTLLSASELVGLDREAFYSAQAKADGMLSWRQKQTRARHYSVAWLLVHMLMHADLPYARQFRATISAPPSPNKGAALGQVVASVPAGDLDRDLHAYYWLEAASRRSDPNARGPRAARASGERGADLVGAARPLSWQDGVSRQDAPRRGLAE